jgi:hypothetical protein
MQTTETENNAPKPARSQKKKPLPLGALGQREAITPTEFAALFGRHKVWAYRQIYAHKVNVVTELGAMMIPMSEVRRLLQAAGPYRQEAGEK